MPSTKPSRAVLDTGLKIIRPLFDVRGFTLTIDDGAGHFYYSTATFRCDPFEVGLIVREFQGIGMLGCPNYSQGKGYAGHEVLVEALGFTGQERLVEGSSFTFRDKNGGDPFKAFWSDLERFIMPAIDASHDHFSKVITKALKLQRKKRGW